LAQGLRPILYNLLPGKDLLDLYESMWPTTTDHLIIFGIGGILIAPVFEELLFRGMILSSIGNKWGYTPAIIITSVLFGILHIIPPEIVMIIIYSIFWSLSVYLTRSILASIIMHSIFNFYGFIDNVFAIESKIIPPINDYLYFFIMIILGISTICIGFFLLKKATGAQQAPSLGNK
jgi:membrane protease YdiL (CAAX protease family)